MTQVQQELQGLAVQLVRLVTQVRQALRVLILRFQVQLVQLVRQAQQELRVQLVLIQP